MTYKAVPVAVALFLCLVLTVTVKANRNEPQELSLKIKPVKQITDYSCGLAGLCCILNYWQVKNNREKLLHKYPPIQSEYGYSLGQLKQIAHRKGLKAFALHGSFGLLKRQLSKERPVLVAMEVPYNLYKLQRAKKIPLLGKLLKMVSGYTFSHFMVVYGVNGQEIKVMDPRYGLQTIPRKNFLDMWEKMNQAMLLVAY